MQKFKVKNLLCLLIIFILLPITIFFVKLYAGEKSFYFTSFIIIIYSFIPFFISYEKSYSQIKLLTIVAVMSTLVVVSRLVFYLMPQFKPVTAIIIISGITLGAESGFMVGAISAFVSNFFFGQGPWTPWQMFCFGMIGFLSGLIFNFLKCKVNKITLSVWGFIASLIIYGAIINISSYMLYYDAKNLDAFLSYYALSLPYDLIHAVSTIIFLLLLGKPLLYQLNRVKNKHELS